MCSVFYVACIKNGQKRGMEGRELNRENEEKEEGKDIAAQEYLGQASKHQQTQRGVTTTKETTLKKSKGKGGG
jgi:hypothetical protein